MSVTDAVRTAKPFSQRLVERIAGREGGPGRRGFLRGSAVVGAALASAPWTFLARPTSAYAAVCGSQTRCADGYTVFCCTINGGRNSCPPNSFIAGWWKADSSSWCGGNARYYIDCNAFRDNAWQCRCNDDPSTCDNRRVACNQFRYGQCNTQVPYSNTGPVVCRIVSCTPPWQQYDGVCSTSSRTDNQTANHGAPCLAGNVPIGRLDGVSTDRDRVTLRGWALDKDAPSTSIRVLVASDDDGSIGVFPTDVPRPDVNAAQGVSGVHGFSATVVPNGGRRVMRVHAMNVGPGPTTNPIIGSSTVDVPVDRAPVGRMDSLQVSGTSVRLVGWAFDPDRPGTSVDVHVYSDGAQVAVLPTSVARPDVNRAFGITGSHGFDGRVELRSGARVVGVYAINAGPGSRHPLLWQRTVDVNPGVVPRGRPDPIRVDGERVVLTGWAYDPDDPAAEIQVAVYEDDAYVGWFPTGVPRPDVNRAFGIPGDHGFSLSVGSAPGSHTWKVYAINVGGGASNPLVASWTGRIGDAGGTGRLDEATVAGTTLRLRGWAYDTSRPSVEVPVGIVVDGGPVTQRPTGLARPDVNAALGITGDHGFDTSVTLTRGRHVVSVFALAAGGDAIIAQREVVA